MTEQLKIKIFERYRKPLLLGVDNKVHIPKEFVDKLKWRRGDVFDVFNVEIEVEGTTLKGVLYIPYPSKLTKLFRNHDEG